MKKELEKNAVLEEKIQPNLENALVVASNKLVRKTTRWNIREQKLFWATISQVKTMSEEGWISLRKSDVLNVLNLGSKHSGELREIAHGMMTKSMICWTGKDKEEWKDGILVTNVESDRSNIRVKMNMEYAPLYNQLATQFTMMELSNIGYFKSKNGLMLWQYLKSWSLTKDKDNNGRKIQTAKISLSLEECKRLFGVEEGSYTRKDGTFRESEFERFTIIPATAEINRDSQKSGMMAEWEKNKSKNGTQYHFYYTILNDIGTLPKPDKKHCLWLKKIPS